MFKKNATTIIRRRSARGAARLICGRIRTEAREQGQTFGEFRRKTGLNTRASVRLWLGLNPPAWAIECSRGALGLTVEQVWKVR